MDSKGAASSAVAVSAPPKFTIPPIHDNPDGWGPSPNYVPEKYRDMPYYPFVKGDKLGRIADWTGQQQFPQRQRHGQQQPVNTVFNYYHVNDDESFTTVDAKPTKPKTYYQRGRFGPRGQRYAQGPTNPSQRGGKQGNQGFQQNQQRKKWNNRGRGGMSGWGAMNRRDDSMRTKRDPSIEVRPEWHLTEEVDLPPLSRIVTQEPEPEELVTCGEVAFYDPEFERITTKSERPLEKTDRVALKATASNDPVMKQLASEGVANVFTTGSILAQIMAAPRSIYSWDLEVRKEGKQIWIDKRDYPVVDSATVNETAHENQNEMSLDPINLPDALTKEATGVNHNFSQQVLQKSGSSYAFEQANPFQKGEQNVAPLAYRYRKWVLKDDFSILARCEVDGAQKTNKAEPELLLLRALNEWDSKAGADYRKSLDSQKGALLATEIKNNSAKLFKWTAQALLSGADAIKLGYVSRHQPKDPQNHVVLGVQGYRPRELATLVGVNPNNCWAVVLHFLKVINKLPDGTFVLLKDPNKPVVRFYEVPKDGKKDEKKEESKPEEPAK